MHACIQTCILRLSCLVCACRLYWRCGTDTVCSVDYEELCAVPSLLGTASSCAAVLLDQLLPGRHLQCEVPVEYVQLRSKQLFQHVLNPSVWRQVMVMMLERSILQISLG